MRGLVLVVLVGCGGHYKAAVAPASPQPTSKLEQVARLDMPASNAQVTAELSSEPAVRHRRALSWKDIDVVADTSQYIGGSPPPPPAAQPLTPAVEQQAEKLVIEAWIDMTTDDVSRAVDTIRSRVVASGGRMVSENVVGSGKSASSAALEFRVPPARATEMTSWLGTLGAVTSRRVMASEVSKQLFDQELALKNLELTMERLQKLATQSGPVADLLTIEKEMTRVRGDIERIKGEQRFLLDRVEMATITVQLTRSGDEPFEAVPEARVYPGPQLALLTLLDPGMRQRTRVGGGASLRIQRYATLEANVFPRGDGGDSRAVLVTFGAALYSSYLQDGHRRYLNPYIGGRAGYGYLSGVSTPVIAGELGCELFKHEYLVVDAAVRGVVFIASPAQAALHATLGVAVPF